MHYLTCAPILSMSNPADEITELHTDASAVSVGAVLIQRERADDSLRLVHCASKKTSETEARSNKAILINLS